MAKLASYLFLVAAAVGVASGLSVEIEKRATGGYIQNPSGSASFTMYSGCGAPGRSPPPFTIV